MFIIVKANTNGAVHKLHRWKNGDQRQYLKSCFVRFLGNGTFLIDPTPALLNQIKKLKERGEGISIFRADLIATDDEFEELYREVWKKSYEKSSVL